MTELSQMVSNYKAIRDRLVSPPNAITDIGIDLKRKRIPPVPPELPVLECAPGVAVTCEVFVAQVPTKQTDAPLKIEEIERAVCACFGISKIQLYARRRTKDVVYPRHICWYLAAKYTRRSLPEIGHRGGGCDHTTILHARNKIERLIKDNPATADIIKVLESMLLKKHESNDLLRSAMATEPKLDMAQESPDSLSQPQIRQVD